MVLYVTFTYFYTLSDGKHMYMFITQHYINKSMYEANIFSAKIIAMANMHTAG